MSELGETEYRPVREFVKFYIGGGWGKEGPSSSADQQVAILRGADFPSASRGDATGLPIRWESNRKVARRSLRSGDIVLEVSGGTKNRPTGRSVYVTQRLLDQHEFPTIPASFCRLIRPDKAVVDPRYLGYWLRDMFVQGRTWGYQVQSTGLANFNVETFLDREVVRTPAIQEQRRIARVLGAFDDLIERDRQLAKSQERLASNWAESVGDSCLLRDLASRSNISVKQPSGIVDHFSLPAFDSGRQPERVDSSSIKSGKLELRDPVVLVSRLNPRIPRVWMAYPDSRATAVASTEFVPLAPIPDVPVECIYAVTSSQRFADEMASHATGTTGSHQRVDKEALLRLEVPDVRALGGDARAALSVLVSTAHGLRQESAVLERTRDELLPLLMSGAVRVSEVEDSVP